MSQDLLLQNQQMEITDENPTVSSMQTLPIKTSIKNEDPTVSEPTSSIPENTTDPALCALTAYPNLELAPSSPKIQSNFKSAANENERPCTGITWKRTGVLERPLGWGSRKSFIDASQLRRRKLRELDITRRRGIEGVTSEEVDELSESMSNLQLPNQADGKELLPESSLPQMRSHKMTETEQPQSTSEVEWSPELKLRMVNAHKKLKRIKTELSEIEMRYKALFPQSRPPYGIRCPHGCVPISLYDSAMLSVKLLQFIRTMVTRLKRMLGFLYMNDVEAKVACLKYSAIEKEITILLGRAISFVYRMSCSLLEDVELKLSLAKKHFVLVQNARHRDI